MLTFFSYTCYVQRQNQKQQQEILSCKLVDEILKNRIDSLEKDLENLEKFRIKILEKNIIIKDNRIWDSVSSSEEEAEDFDEEIDD